MPNKSGSRILRPPPSYLVAILLVAVVARFLLQHCHAAPGSFLHCLILEDLPIYANALNDWHQGLDPYRTIHGSLRFVYPPVFLYAGGFFAHILPAAIGPVSIGTALYTVLHLVSTLALPIVLATYYFEQTWLNASFAVLVFLGEPRLTGMLGLYSGNIASTLYLCAFLAAIPGLRRNRWGLFYLAVCIAATVKLPLLLLLLLPLLAGTRQWIQFVACVAAVVTVTVLQKVLTPVLYSGYQLSLVEQIRVMHHYGYGALGIVAGLETKLHHDVGIMATLASGVFSLVLIAILFYLRPRIERPSVHPLWLALVLLTIILANPRILHYDADIGLFATFVIFVLVFRIRRPIFLLMLLFLPSLIVPVVIHTPTLYGLYETMLMTLAFCSASYHLLRDPEAGQLPPTQALL